MSLKSKIIFALAILISLSGCSGEFANTSSGGSNSTLVDDTPADSGDQGQGPGELPLTPAPPEDGPGLVSGQLCYNFYSSGPCYSLQNIDAINQAENMYNYIGPGEPGFPSGLNPIHYRKPRKLYFVPEVGSNQRVAPNFVRREFVRANSTRGHYGYFSPLVVDKVQALREHFGRALKINSGYRSPGYNATLNGAARFSRHTYGDAIDFKINGVSFNEIASVCRQLGAAFTQIYTSHVHCDWRSSPLDTQVFGQADANASPLSHLEVQSLIEAHSHIFAESLDDQGAYQFAAETDQEDGPGLVHEWELYRNGEFYESSNDASPVLKLASGEYQVYVKVGGNVEIETQLSVQ